MNSGFFLIFKKKSAKKKKSPGFTLMEVMIALMIASVIMASLMAVFIRSLETAQEVEDSSVFLQMVRMTINRIEADMNSRIYEQGFYHQPRSSGPPSDTNGSAKGGKTNSTNLSDPEEKSGWDLSFSGANFDFKDLFFQEGEEDEEEVIESVFLSFPTWALLESDSNSSFALPGRVEYILEPDMGGQKLVRIMRRRGLFNAGGNSTSNNVEVADGLTTVELRFFDKEGDPDEAWNSTEKEGWPEIVSLKLGFLDPQGQERVFKSTLFTRLGEPNATLEE